MLTEYLLNPLCINDIQVSMCERDQIMVKKYLGQLRPELTFGTDQYNFLHGAHHHERDIIEETLVPVGRRSPGARLGTPVILPQLYEDSLEFRRTDLEA
jgi:hypothetical protein